MLPEVKTLENSNTKALVTTVGVSDEFFNGGVYGEDFWLQVGDIKNFN
jgi:hypothetical protein